MRPWAGTPAAAGSSKGENRIQQHHDPSRRPHLVLALLLPKGRDKGGLGMSWLGVVEEGNKSEVEVQSSEMAL